MKLFISYSSQDSDPVRALVADLEREHYEVWLDEELGGGIAWWDAILEQIRACTVFIFALSTNSLRSEPCKAELAYATELRLPILPVQIGALKIPRTDPIVTLQIVNYRPSVRNRESQLLSAIRETAQRRAPLTDPLPDPPPMPYEYLHRRRDQLSPTKQAAILFELRSALDEERDETVRDDIQNLLQELRRRRDVAYAVVRDMNTFFGETADGPASSSATTDKSSSDPALSAKAPPLPQQKRKRRMAITAVAAASLLTVGIVVVLANRAHGPATRPSDGQPSPAVPVVYIGTDCATFGAKGISETGKTAYCANLEGTGETVWVRHERGKESYVGRSS